MNNLHDRVESRAGRIDAGRAAKSAAALPFFAAGFLIGLVARMALWCAAASALGFADGRGRRDA